MMASIVSSLDLERERQLMKLLPESARLHLLYKGSHHGFNQYIISKFDKVGQFVILVYLNRPTGHVRGAYLSKPPKEKQEDKNAFLFELTPDSAFQYLQQDQARAVAVSGSNVSFGESLKFTYTSTITYTCSTLRMVISFGTGETFAPTGWKEDPQANYSELELHRVQTLQSDVEILPWRELSWGENDRLALKEKLLSFKPACQSLNRIRVLLLGPAGSGKSSFINSVRSALYGRVMLLPYTGTGTKGSNKRLKSHNIRSEDKATALTLVDVPALGVDKETPGLIPSDTLAVINGQVPERHQFISEAPIKTKVSGHRPEPTTNDKIHCAVFVLHACHVMTTTETLQETLRTLQVEISDMDIPQVVLLTHVDRLCHAVQEDVQYVYTSRTVQEKMQKAAEVVGLPVSYVLPVRNYSSQQSVNCNTDILILSAVNHILQAVDDTYEQSRPPSPGPPKSTDSPVDV